MQQYATQSDYYAKSLADSFKNREQPFGRGLRVFDISNPASPREIAFLQHAGLRRTSHLWVGGRYAYVSVHLEGFIDHVLAIVDLADPAKPVLAGHWWLPGMWRAGGETPPPSFGKRTALHHMITAGNLGYSAWRDGGYTIHNLSDPVHPKLLSHANYGPPFGGGAHTTAAPARPQAAGTGGRSDHRELRQRAGLHLGDRTCARRTTLCPSPHCRRRTTRISAQGRQIRTAQSA